MSKKRGINISLSTEDQRHSCLDKVHFPNRNKARDAAARRRPAVLHPYRCMVCTGWHLTSREPEQHSSIRRAIRRRGGT